MAVAEAATMSKTLAVPDAARDAARWADVVDSRPTSVSVPCASAEEAQQVGRITKAVADYSEHAATEEAAYGGVEEEDSDEDSDEDDADQMGQLEIASSGGITASTAPGGYSAKHLMSVGSRYHDNGRCKPCAFFHTKGCQSGTACLFCHICPMHEKQRRKRLRRQLCHTLLSGSYGRMVESSATLDTAARRKGKGQSKGEYNGKVEAGHSRVNSGSTTASTIGWGKHARQWSTSTQGSCVDMSPAAAQGGMGVYPYGHDFGQDMRQHMDGHMLPTAAAEAQARHGQAHQMPSPKSPTGGEANSVPLMMRNMGEVPHATMLPNPVGYGQAPQSPMMGDSLTYVNCNGMQYALVPVPGHDSGSPYNQQQQTLEAAAVAALQEQQLLQQQQHQHQQQHQQQQQQQLQVQHHIWAGHHAPEHVVMPPSPVHGVDHGMWASSPAQSQAHYGFFGGHHQQPHQSACW